MPSGNKPLPEPVLTKFYGGKWHHRHNELTVKKQFVPFNQFLLNKENVSIV